MHTLTAPSHTQPRVFMLFPCSLVFPGTDELLLSRVLTSSRYPQKHVPFHYHMCSRVYVLTGIQRAYTQAKVCRDYTSFIHSHVHSTHTDIDRH